MPRIASSKDPGLHKSALNSFNRATWSRVRVYAMECLYSLMIMLQQRTCCACTHFRRLGAMSDGLLFLDRPDCVQFHARDSRLYTPHACSMDSFGASIKIWIIDYFTILCWLVLRWWLLLLVMCSVIFFSTNCCHLNIVILVILCSLCLNWVLYLSHTHTVRVSLFPYQVVEFPCLLLFSLQRFPRALQNRTIAFTIPDPVPTPELRSPTFIESSCISFTFASMHDHLQVIVWQRENRGIRPRQSRTQSGTKHSSLQSESIIKSSNYMTTTHLCKTTYHGARVTSVKPHRECNRERVQILLFVFRPNEDGLVGCHDEI